MKAVNIGVIINSQFATNTEQMLTGIKNAYTKLKDYKITYKINVMNPKENVLDDYKLILKSYKDYDGVILTGMSSQKYTDIINKLYEDNPNIVQVQAINKDANYLFGSKHSEEIASNLAADFLYSCLKKCENKNILLFTGDLESSLHSSAQTAFKKACKKSGMTLLETIDMKDNEEYFEEILSNTFEKYKDKVDGIYITSGFSAPLCKYLEENQIDTAFVAFDTYENIKTYMNKGIILATVAQNVSHQMETAFEALVKYLITGKKPPKTIYTDIQIALKSNIQQFK